MDISLENSINPLNNIMKKRLPLGIYKKNDNFTVNLLKQQEQLDKNYEHLFNHRNSLDFCQGPNDIVGKNK